MKTYLLHHLLLQEQDVNKAALLAKNEVVSYGLFRKRSNALAAELFKRGLKPGDRCVVFLPKVLAECWSIFGVSVAQGVVVPVNSLLKGPQVAHILTDCEARFLLTTRDKFHSFSPSVVDAETCEVIFVDELDLDAGSTAPVDVRIGEDLAAILYTSGSTGLPKGVMLSHRNLLAGTRIVSSYLRIGPTDRLASVLSFSFDYGLNQLLTSVANNASIVLVPFRVGEDIVRAIREFDITGLAGVPTVWSLLIASAPSLKREPLPGLRFLTNSGGAVPQLTLDRLRERLPETEIFLMYGLTEAFRSTFLSPNEIDSKPGSIGKAIPECEVMVLRDDGELAQPGETGILIHRGPTVSMGYWRCPEATAKVIKPNPLKSPNTGVDMVCYSGDRVRIDEEGYLYFVGRNDSMIKTSGYRLSPTEVEDALMMTGAFSSVCVFGLPDSVLGQRVHAVATATSDEPVETRAILSQLSNVLPPYMIPRQIEVIDKLPQTPNGKVNIKQLVEERK
ncbi:AMP-binding protein [Henriciella sp.]|uniref:AMP-binding protein n=1 Tax=Henriciella sp. TaxID=1968823 RepID=UPI00262A753C|nr:AMP-binding protein [Henriciella sp.]